jgi:anti-sigma regulatory factor (Ser/Thr protein kinase)
MTTTAVFPVEEASQIAEPRREVLSLAERQGLSEERCGRAALVVSELATNLVKHARGGEILLRALTTASGASEGIEIVAIDRGPGIPDLALARRDGHSTTGTLGHGLGAIERQADFFQLHTLPSGTAAVARVYADGAAGLKAADLYEIGAVQVSKTGEQVCGDAWSWRMRGDRLSILIADGLGHGQDAHRAATAAIAAYERAHDQPPGRVVEDVHTALRSTRGAAVAMLAVDLERNVARYAGLGNIGATIFVSQGRHNLVSHNGTAGHTAARIQEFSYPAPKDALIVMFSDGLGTHWDLSAYPGLRTRSASLVAAVLYRDFSRHRDDVTVVVAKPRPPAAEKM